MARGDAPPMVEVTWMDARSLFEQLPLSEAPAKIALVHRRSLGYLVAKDKERVLLCHTFDAAQQEDEADGGADYLILPRSWVVKVRELQAGGEHAEGV